MVQTGLVDDFGYRKVQQLLSLVAQRAARFVVDLEMERDLRAAGLSDDPADTVNYAQVFKLVREIMEGTSRKLLENVAETIAQRVLESFDVESVMVRVKKPEVPMKGSILAHASVEIFRKRGESS